MSAHLQRLAELILTEHLGDTVTSVGLVLIRTGKRTLRDVIKEAKLKKDEVQKSLLVLMQHGLVRCEAGGVGLYEFNLTRLLAILYYPKYIAAVKPLYGDASELVVEDLLCNGSSLLSSTVQRVAEKLEGRGTAHKEPQELAEMVKLAFQALVQKCYVMRHTNRPSTAGEESSDEATSPSHPPAAASFAPLPEPLLQGIVYRKRLRSDVDSSAPSEGDAEGGGEPTAKRLKRTDNPAKEEGSEPVDAGVQWVVNSERFLYQMKHNSAVAAITRKIDAVAGNVLNSLLKLAAANNPLCSGKGTSKPVFAADVFRDLQGSRVHLNSEQLDQYLKILCDEKFLQHQGDGGGGVYGINFKHIDRILCQSAIESIVRERFGPKSHRIFRLILLKKYLDQKQVADMAMLPQKEAKEMLYTLVAEHMVTIQEVPKSQDYAPARTFYLFSVSLQQVARVVLNRCYKAVGNLMMKRKAEREEHRRLLEQQQIYKRRRLVLEQQGAGEEERQELEETLTPEERKTIERVQQTLDRLEQAELKVADTILLLTAFLQS